MQVVCGEYGGVGGSRRRTVVLTREVGNAKGVRAAYLGAGYAGCVRRFCDMSSRVVGYWAWGV